MPLLARMVAAPLQVSVGSGTIGSVAEMLEACRMSRNGQVAMVVGTGMGDAVLTALGDQVNLDRVVRVGRGTIDEAVDVASRLNTSAVDAVVGIGGGRTLDVAKFASTRLGLPMLAVATNLAHDGIASPVSVLRHGVARRSYGVAAPAAVMVDLDFVERAPEHFLKSGIGDVVSNISAIADWRLSHELTGEPIDGVAAALASTAAEAVLAQPGKPSEPAFLRCLAEALILSGLAMSAAGTSRPCSGACHEISHALDHLYPGLASHGEQVAIGALFAMFLRGDAPRVRHVAQVFERHGLPLTPTELEMTERQFVDAVLYAPATRPDRFTILEHLDLDEHGAVRAVHEFTEFVRC
jgi:glycerol-1-phosphate dehydrogenase [NAD(P)+]